jgi:hypothetical protein
VVSEKLCADASFLGLSCREKTILGIGEAVECGEIWLLVYVRHFYSIPLVYADKHVDLADRILTVSLTESQAKSAPAQL